MVIDLNGFCAGVRLAENKKNLDVSLLSGYLMQNLFAPYISGEEVQLDSLDYSAFSLDYLMDLHHFLGDAEEIESKLDPMRSKLVKCEPAARKHRGFC